MDRRLIKISKYMSYLLRHDPKDLELDERGFVPITDLLDKLREKFPDVRMDDIETILKNSNKRRFQLEGERIRAIYGHSIKLKELRYPRYEPESSLYHGTTEQALASIMVEGIKPMSRLMVHLSRTVEDALKVAVRHRGKPVILEVDAVSASRDGIAFFDAGDVILTHHIPPKYIKVLK